MSEKHFRLREDLTIEVCGKKLFRIEATKDIEKQNVKAGELGGYVEKEENLTENAWVTGNALVTGDARVTGNAWVTGDALVTENALVTGNALVFGDAWVDGKALVDENAWVTGNALVTGDARVTGDALVTGNALVTGDARVTGNAWVDGNARVTENALVTGNALVFGDAWVTGKARVVSATDCRNIINERYNVTILPEHIQIGCQFHKKKDWWGFSDREILTMDGRDGLKWWKKWKPILMAICEAEREGEDETE